MKVNVLIATVVLAVAIIGGAAYWLFVASVIKGSGVEFVESRELEAVYRIDLACAADLDVLVGERQEIVVAGDDNLVPLILTDFSEGRLTIRCEERYRSSLGIRVTVTVPKLDQLVLSGSGDISAGHFEGERFTTEISGSGNLKMGSFVGHTCELEISGSGNIELGEFSGMTLLSGVSGSGNIVVRGDASQLESKISGSGNLDLSELIAKKGVTKISGSGNIKVNVGEALEVGISGSGNVTQSGRAKPMAKISGSGKVIQK